MHIIWLGYLFVIMMFCFARQHVTWGGVVCVAGGVAHIVCGVDAQGEAAQSIVSSWEAKMAKENSDVVAK